MLYHVSRGGQTYGPYTLADLERYVESGHIVPGDLIKSDEIPEWVPLSSILQPSFLQPKVTAEVTAEYGSGGPAASAQGYGPGTPTSAAPLREPYPSAPNLHWGLLLLIDLLTGTLFQMVWNVIVALWMRRVQPNSRALYYYAAGYGLVLVYTWLRIPAILGSLHGRVVAPTVFVSVVGVLSWVGRLAARFSMKSSLEEHYNTVEPIGLRLNGFLVFFFGGLYIQSQLNRIRDIQIAMQYRGPVY